MSEPMPENPAEPQRLIDAMLDGELTAEGAAALERWLAADAEHRRDYVRASFLHRQLRDVSAVAKLDAIDEASAPPRRINPRWRWAAGVLVAVGIAAFASLTTGRSAPSPDPGERRQGRHMAGVLMQADAVRWVGPDADAVPEAGAALPVGPIAFDSGTIEVEFFSGVRATIQGPARVELTGSNSVAMTAGRLAAVVPAGAVGFSVATPRARIVDLGTEFAVTTGWGEDDELHVIDGEVKLITAASELRVAGGDSRAIGGDGAVRDLTAAADFARPEPIAPEPYRRWVAYRNRLRADPSLVLYYSFQGQTADDAEAHDQSGRGHAGEIRGATIDRGRVPGKPALRFDGGDDRIRFRVPGAFENVTFAMWANLDALDHPFNALMHTDGWETSEPHWLIDERGGLYFNIRAVVFKQGFGKPAEATPDELIGRWRMLAAVYDHAAGEVRFYIDGQLRMTGKSERVLPLVINWAEVGNWTGYDAGSDRRGIRGRIDEFAMFDRVLSESELRDLYESGRNE